MGGYYIVLRIGIRVDHVVAGIRYLRAQLVLQDRVVVFCFRLFDEQNENVGAKFND